MPYLPRGFPQALDLIDAGVEDVYYSPNVFINNVQAALWLPPQTGNSFLTALNIPVPAPLADYAPNPEQIKNFKVSQAYAEAHPDELEDDNGQVIKQAQASPPGPRTSDPNDYAGDPEPIQSGVTPPPSGAAGLWGSLESYLNQLKAEGDAGKWTRTRTEPGNPNILNCYAHTIGVANAKRIKPADLCPWCAAFVGTVLQSLGIPALKTATADSYAKDWVRKCGAKSIPVNDPTQWRRNDIFVKQHGSDQHIAFVRGVDPSSGSVRLLGGNQGDRVSEVNFLNTFRYRAFVGRAWDIPPEADKPIVGSLGGGGAVKTR